MLEPVEVLPPQRRRTLRRAVQLDCDVISELWDEPIPHVVTDLSPEGAWVETPFPLEVGSQMLVSFTPPRWRPDRSLVCLADVRQVRLGRRSSDPCGAGMGLEFRGLSPRQGDELRATLRGLPPPLPPGAAPHRSRRELIELVWVDGIVSDADRVSSVAPPPLAQEATESTWSIAPLGELVTGGIRAGAA